MPQTPMLMCVQYCTVITNVGNEARAPRPVGLLPPARTPTPDAPPRPTLGRTPSAYTTRRSHPAAALLILLLLLPTSSITRYGAHTLAPGPTTTDRRHTRPRNRTAYEKNGELAPAPVTPKPRCHTTHTQKICIFFGVCNRRITFCDSLLFHTI